MRKLWIIYGVVGVLASTVLALGLLKVFPHQQTAPPPRQDRVTEIMQYQVKGAKERSQKLKVPREPSDPKAERHYHAALRVVINGAEFHPPRSMGIVDGGNGLAIHTHDDSGTVHFHPPKGHPNLTLKQTLGVWGLTYQEKQFGPWKLEGWDKRLSLNGKELEYGKNLEFKERDDVVIYLASPGVGDEFEALKPFRWSKIPVKNRK